MPINAVNSFKHLLSSAVVVSIAALTACTAPPEKPTTAEEKETVIEKKTDLNASAKPPEKELSQQDYLKLRSTAASNGNWAAYLNYSTLAWQKSKAAQQAKIEEQAWGIVNSLSVIERDKLANSNNVDVQAWHALYEFINGEKFSRPQHLLNLQSFDSDAIFSTHLLPKLLAEQPKQESIKQIAILLPMQGKYKVISQQIRNGIVKAFYASNQDLTLKFYDSSDLNELENIYTIAKQEGADRIIGPLRKEAVQLLASFHDNNQVALNSLENMSTPQFNFNSASPQQQMRERFHKVGFKRIGIMTNNKKRNVADAQLLQNLWQQDENQRAELSIYPNERPKLREALGKLIHESNSKERRNNIRWAVAEKIEYFPRIRQDLDAIVIMDNINRLSVFRPQFDFFALDVPLYSDSKLTPKDFQNIKLNKDLKEVEFLSLPAALKPVDLNNKFEAFGWDSFLVSTHLEELQNGACLTNAKTGILSMQAAQVKQRQIWLTYNKQGELQEAPFIQPLMPTEEALVEAANNSTSTDLTPTEEQIKAQEQAITLDKVQVDSAVIKPPQVPAPENINSSAQSE